MPCIVCKDMMIIYNNYFGNPNRKIERLLKIQKIKIKFYCGSWKTESSEIKKKKKAKAKLRTLKLKKSFKCYQKNCNSIPRLILSF